MNSNLIKIFAFFLGLFIALIIISYIRINESFTDISSSSLISPIMSLTSPLKTLSTLSTITTSIINNDNNDDSIIPFKGYKFMCINTYYNINNISINDGKWYEIDSTMNYIDYNYNNYFKFSKIINLEHNKLNNKIGVKGADISTIELTGPSCFNFANNNETFELTEFTMFMTIKLLSCSNNNNVIFEMTGNTTTIDYLIPKYKTSMIHINIILNENKNYKIVLLIGDIIYESDATNNIDKDIIENSNYYTIGLYYTKEKLGLIFNDKIYEYVNKNIYKITLGSTPIIINKNGSINMHLYNFVYYKSLFNFEEYDYFIRYNNYYISGLYAKECIKDNSETNKPVKDIEINKLKDIQKIILPKFKYPILHNNNNDDDDDDNDNDNDESSNSNHKFKYPILHKNDKDDNNKNDDKDDDETANSNSKFKYPILHKGEDNEDETNRPNIFKRLFGF